MGKIYRMILWKKTKNFLRDWRKFAVFAVFFLIVIAYGALRPKVVPCFLPACPESQWMNAPWRFCPICSFDAYDYVAGAAYYALFPTSLLYEQSESPYLLFALQVLYWFALSLLAVWAYDRLKAELERQTTR